MLRGGNAAQQLRGMVQSVPADPRPENPKSGSQFCWKSIGLKRDEWDENVIDTRIE